jgi:hypothetical protein
MPSPGEPQAEPTIGQAINGGYDLLEAMQSLQPRFPGRVAQSHSPDGDAARRAHSEG